MWDINSKSDSASAPRGAAKLKKLKRIKSTNTILWRYFSLFACFLVAVISLVFYGILASAGLNKTRDGVRSFGDKVAERISLGEDVDIIGDSFNYGYYAFVFNSAGENLLDTTDNEQIIGEIWSELESNKISWSDGASFEFSTKSDGQSIYNYVKCVVYDGENAMLVLRYPIGSVASSVATMELAMLGIAVGAILIALVISYTLASKLSSPLKEVSDTASKLAAGDYSVQFSSAQYTEIAALSASLNYMKDEMKKADDFQRELLANVTHDLKTPLTMIKAYAAMIKEISGDDKEKREKHLQVIIDESDRLTGLVNDILSASKISSELNQLNIKVFNLTETLYGIINKFAYLQETQGYSIMVDVDSNLYTRADEEKIKQVVYNLVSNAINYTGADKTVYISLKYEPSSDMIKFAVRDTGKGISENELAHIWDRYYRSKDSHTRPVKGTGLGLNIVKSILKAHGFAFGVTSKQDEGSTFYAVFPAVSSTPENL